MPLHDLLRAARIFDRCGRTCYDYHVGNIQRAYLFMLSRRRLFGVKTIELFLLVGTKAGIAVDNPGVTRDKILSGIHFERVPFLLGRPSGRLFSCEL